MDYEGMDYPGNFTDEYFNEVERPFVTQVIISLSISAIVLLISLACNGLVVAVVARRPQLQHFPYLGLSCLAITDILSCLAVVAMSLFYSGYFKMIDICCKVVFAIPVFTDTFTALTLTAIAIFKLKDREGLMGRRDVGKGAGVLVSLSLVAAATCSFTFVIYRTTEVVPYNICIAGSLRFYQEIHDIIIGTFNYIICSVIVISCLVVSRRRRSKEVVAVDEDGVVVDAKERVDVRFENMMLTAWVVFLVMGLLLEVNKKLMHHVGFSTAIYWTQQSFYYIHILYKLFLYRGMDGHFRKELSALLAGSQAP